MPPTPATVTAHSANLTGVTASALTVTFTTTPGPPSLRVHGVPERTAAYLEQVVLDALRATRRTLPDRQVHARVCPEVPVGGGAALDLALALGWAAAAGLLPPELLERRLLVGTLTPGGQVRAPHGAGALAHLASPLSFDEVLVPSTVADQAAALACVEVIGVATLRAAFRHLLGPSPLSPTPRRLPEAPRPLRYVFGFDRAVRVLAIAAAGGHHGLLLAPANTPRVSLAHTLLSLLPPLDGTDVRTFLHLRSAGGDDTLPSEIERPLRAPHPAAPFSSVLGSSVRRRLGECTLAHGGVLFLDGAEAIDRLVLNALREPLTDGIVTFYSRPPFEPPIVLPARFTLLATAPTCPCSGSRNPLDDECRCTPQEIDSYRDVVADPIRPHLDLQVDLEGLPDAAPNAPLFTSRAEAMRCIDRARERQLARRGLYDSTPRLNGQQTSLDVLCRPGLDFDAVDLLDHLASHGVTQDDRVALLRVARTIADLDDADVLTFDHLDEALGYRQLALPVEVST